MLRQQLGEPEVSTSANSSPYRRHRAGEAERLRSEIFARLVAALDDPDSQVRCAAIRAFESLGTNYDPKLLERLIAIARDTTTRVRRGASICRQDLASGTEGYVRKAVDERLRVAAIDCMANFEMYADAVVPVLIDAIADGDPLTRLHAVSALGSVGRPAKSTVPALIELLRAMRATDDIARPEIVEAERLAVPIKLAALGLLGEIGCDSSPAIPVLIDLLFDPVLEVREQSAAVLGEIGREAAVCVPALVKQIRRGRLEVSTGKEVVSAIGLPAQFALIEIVSNRKLPDEERLGAAEFLGFLGSDAAFAIPELESAMAAAEPALHRVIKEAIGAIKEDDDASKFGEDMPDGMGQASRRRLQVVNGASDRTSNQIGSVGSGWPSAIRVQPRFPAMAACRRALRPRTVAASGSRVGSAPSIGIETAAKGTR